MIFIPTPPSHTNLLHTRADARASVHPPTNTSTKTSKLAKIILHLASPPPPLPSPSIHTAGVCGRSKGGGVVVRGSGKRGAFPWKRGVQMIEFFWPNYRALLPTFGTNCPDGSHFAQNTTSNPCFLLSRHPLSGICMYTKHPQPQPKTPLLLA